MQKTFRKSIVFVIIGLFIGASVVPSISGNNENDHNTEMIESIDVVYNTLNDQLFQKQINDSSDIDWWSKFHHDSLNSGYSTSKAPNTNNVKWSYKTDDWIHTSPAIVDGKVYFGSYDDYVYCLDAETGDMIWRYKTKWGVGSSPAIADGKVYIGSRECNMYCLDAETGIEIWRYFVHDNVLSSPAVVDGKVYFGSENYYFYCLDAETGYEIWSYYTGNTLDSSPVVVDGKVYFGSRNNKVYCLDAKKGHMIWNYRTNDWVQSSPAVADGKVYIGSSDGFVYCLDAETGDMIWRYKTAEWVWSSPAVAYGKVYIGSMDDYVYCLDAETGNKTWSYKTEWNVKNSPAVADGKVYIGSMDKKLYCLDAETGNKIWSYKSKSHLSSPAVADGRIFIGFGSPLYCFEDAIPDLSCNGSLIWNKLNPGENVSGSFKVENIGDSGSQLDWVIESYPNWGNWTFTPSEGYDLTPENGEFTVDVIVVAPDEKNQNFTGEIKIVNKENTSDYDTIVVSLSTPKSKTLRTMLIQFLENHPRMLPILRHLIGLK